MAIFAILASFLSINMINTQPRASLNSTITSLVADIKHQQLKVISGITKDESNSDFGLYFDTNSYILFAGSSYSPSDSSNFEVNLDDNLFFSNVTLVNSSIIFSQNTGDVAGFVDGSDTVTLTNSLSNDQKVITINRFGSIISVN